MSCENVVYFSKKDIADDLRLAQMSLLNAQRALDDIGANSDMMQVNVLLSRVQGVRSKLYFEFEQENKAGLSGISGESKGL